MNGDFYSETYTYREGRILLYKRPNSQNFQCRLRIEGIKGYTIKSCDTPNQGKALKFAEDLEMTYQLQSILYHKNRETGFFISTLTQSTN